MRRGRPVKSKAGQTFTKWLEQLRDLGYDVEWRELVAADYGAPTTRKRFFLIARCDGRPIAWPEPTHAPRDSEAVKAGKLKPWRSAAEIIDWSATGYSIFASKRELKEKYGVNAVRPLADNTLRRVIRGVDKFTLKSGKPFIFQCKFDNQPQSVDNPLGTITAVNSHHVIVPSLIQYHTERHEHVRGQDVTEPLMTIDAANRYGLAAASLTAYYGADRHGQDAKAPLRTVTARDRAGLTLASLVKMKGTNLGGAASEPVQTITAGGGHHGVVTTEVRKAEPGAELHNWPKIRGLLNIHCGYALADDEVLLLELGGTWYFIADIGLRMLIPRELYRANGFPDDYIIDRDYTGREYPKFKQTARCGNAVPPPFAEALVRANLPEWCS